MLGLDVAELMSGRRDSGSLRTLLLAYGIALLDLRASVHDEQSLRCAASLC
jgi:hypothetical protein